MDTSNNTVRKIIPNFETQLNIDGSDFPHQADNFFIDISPGTSKYCNQDSTLDNVNKNDSASLESTEFFVCRICHNSENPEKLVSPCLCKGSLSYVHIDCLERWISVSNCTTCELCQFQYNTEQTLRYTLYQSLRMWYSRNMSRRALQEDCQMFSLLTLVAFGIVGTLLVAVQYYILQGHISGLGRLWTKGWLIFFLFTTLIVYFVNVYMIIKSQLMPWYSVLNAVIILSKFQLLHALIFNFI
ncbi:E3 ubiquitin-protein ligase MARCHF3 isoform X2 [Lucilia cuprina]|uniref:E3 ubiquitin-protein ligase MARCHF3 isoform X2 n=1 Tax=Lucilia cuprina TaxID=7375 RepID=UPI001F055DB2|nr:E3 ubiquitin-protein ligase MARCHF3 isoform X2 [Lucilia cuprina]